MSIIIKQFLCEKYNNTEVTIDNIEEIANEIAAIQSKQKTSLSNDDVVNMISRYIDTSGGKMKINISKRHPKQNFEMIKQIASGELIHTKESKKKRKTIIEQVSEIDNLFKNPAKASDNLDTMVIGDNSNKLDCVNCNVNDDQMQLNTENDDILMENEQRRTKVLCELMEINYPAQRSSEWFGMRETMITASDGGTVVGLNPYEKPYEFILKKVFGKPFQTSIDCYHGKKYEAVATNIYSYRMNVKIEEFGLCRHKKYSFLGASPDGIVGKYKFDGKHLTKYVGRMIEIKCPMRRKINDAPNTPEVYGIYEDIIDMKTDVKKGICPTYYWVQVQLQLQCCDLDECDFVQCEITEYPSRQEFLNDTDIKCPWKSRESGLEKGVVIQILPIEKLIREDKMSINEIIWNNAEFIHQPKINMTQTELDNWILQTHDDVKNSKMGMIVDRIIYWKLNKINTITINRDNKWFEANLHKFEKMWNCVEYYKTHEDDAKYIKDYITSNTKHQFGRKNTIAPTTIMNVIEELINKKNDKSTI